MIISKYYYAFAILAYGPAVEAGLFETALQGTLAAKVLSGLILFFLVMSLVLFKRMPIKWRDLWKDRKKLDSYQQHLNQIDNVLARAQALAKLKSKGQSDWQEQKNQIEAEIKELLKQSPLNKTPTEGSNVSKLDARAQMSNSKLSGKFKAK